VEDLRGGEETSAKEGSIVPNSRVGCYVYGLLETIEEGCVLAKKTLISLKVEEVLKNWSAVSKEIAGRE